MYMYYDGLSLTYFILLYDIWILFVLLEIYHCQNIVATGEKALSHLKSPVLSVSSIRKCWIIIFSSRNYYGSKIAMYFAWLGFYTQMLVVPSIIGLIIFIYGVAYMDDSYPRYVSCMPVPQL